MRISKSHDDVRGKKPRGWRLGVALLAALAMPVARAQTPPPQTIAAHRAPASTAEPESPKPEPSSVQPRALHEPVLTRADVRLASNWVARSYPARFGDVPVLNSPSLELAIPSMGGDGHGIRDQSPTEQLIRQVRREGMPLARLWQNEEALVSFGLNRKGKPGLWIIQKTR